MSSNMKESLEIEKIHAEIVELRQRVDESIARTSKITKETKWYEFVVMAGFIIGTLAAAKWFVS